MGMGLGINTNRTLELSQWKLPLALSLMRYHIHALMKFIVNFHVGNYLGQKNLNYDNRVHHMCTKLKKGMCALLQVFMACLGVQSKEKYCLHGKL